MTLNRRSLITGLIALVAAPAIVRVGSLMPVRNMIEPIFDQITRLSPGDSMCIHYSKDNAPRYICTHAGITSGVAVDWLDGVPRGSTAKFILDRWS